MGRSSMQRPEHQSPHELRLWAIVDSLVTDISEKEAYLAFARELAVAERSSSFVRRSSTRKPGTVPPSTCVGLSAVQSPSSEATKRVVEKWFRRGLSGHLMWLIGEAVLGRSRITKL
jgi:hypothetical protein